MLHHLIVGPLGPTEDALEDEPLQDFFYCTMDFHNLIIRLAGDWACPLLVDLDLTLHAFEAENPRAMWALLRLEDYSTAEETSEMFDDVGEFGRDEIVR